MVQDVFDDNKKNCVVDITKMLVQQKCNIPVTITSGSYQNWVIYIHLSAYIYIYIQLYRFFYAGSANYRKTENSLNRSIFMFFIYWRLKLRLSGRISDK